MGILCFIFEFKEEVDCQIIEWSYFVVDVLEYFGVLVYSFYKWVDLVIFCFMEL